MSIKQHLNIKKIQLNIRYTSKSKKNVLSLITIITSTVLAVIIC